MLSEIISSILEIFYQVRSQAKERKFSKMEHSIRELGKLIKKKDLEFLSLMMEPYTKGLFTKINRRDMVKKDTLISKFIKENLKTIYLKEKVLMINIKGLYTWKNGSTYEGNFTKGKRNGEGTWTSSQHSDIYIYEGEYHDDKKNGFGIYKFPDGTQYEGFFKDDLKHGNGKIKYADGRINNYEWKEDNKIRKID